MTKNYYMCLLFYLLIGAVMVYATPSCMQEITLVECAITPMDDRGSEGHEPNPPTRFRATINGYELFVSANTNKTAHLIVENHTTGDIVEEKTFISSIPLHISQQGDYTLYIISDDTAVMGEFTIGE